MSHNRQSRQFESSDQDQSPYPTLPTSQYLPSSRSQPLHPHQHPMTSTVQQIHPHLETPAPYHRRSAPEPAVDYALFEAAIAAQHSNRPVPFSDSAVDLNPIYNPGSQPHSVQPPFQPHPQGYLYPSSHDPIRPHAPAQHWRTAPSQQDPRIQHERLPNVQQHPSFLSQPPQPSYNPNFPRHDTSKRPRERDFPPPPTVPSTVQAPEERPSVDTRKGKERVQRRCSSCGTMNHIRKNKCKSCGAPKEPAKKRTKRTRRKKSSETGASSVTQSGNVPYEIFHTAGASSAGQASIEPQESLQVAEVGQTQEINPVFDTRNFMMMQQAHGGEIHGSGGGGNPQLTSDTRREGGTSNEPIVYDGGNQDLTTPFRDPRS